MYTHLIAVLHVLTGTLRRNLRDERGFSLSVEKLLLVIGVIAIAGLVIAGLTAYIQSLLARIN